MSYATVPMSPHEYQDQYQDDNVDHHMIDHEIVVDQMVDQPHSMPQKSFFGKVKSFINMIKDNNKLFSSDYSTVSQNQDQDQDQDQVTKNIIKQKKSNASNSVHCFEDIV
jgi:hypothetical protein